MLLVAQVKTFPFSVHSSSFTETDSTIGDFHYRILKPYFEGENIIIYLMKFSISVWLENNLHGLRKEFLSIAFCKQTNKHRMTTFSLNKMQ